jgi:long-chain fatty acid transport protein
VHARRALGFLLLAGCGSSALALTDEEVFRDFRFNLINPGARSLAVGGAFIALADDATAAQANPAGLSYLLRPEYFAEYRWVDNGGSSSILRETLPTGIETFVSSGTDPADFGSPSFLSFVYPLGRLTLGVSRQDVLHNENETLSSFAFTFPGTPGAFLVRGQGSIDARVTSYNASAGYRIGDRWAVGGSIAYSLLDVGASVDNVIVDTSGAVAGRPILEPTLDLRTSIDDDDTSYGVNLGVLFRATSTLSVGAVYRRAPSFSVTETIDPEVPDADGDGYPDAGIDTLHKRAIFGCDPALPCRFENRFHLPDSYGIAIAWQARDNLTFSEDVERIHYSNQLDGYRAGVNVLTSPDAVFRADDVWEVRMGAEYVLVRKVPVAFRLGLYTEHDNAIRAVSTGTDSFATAASFPGRDGHVHGTAGAGAVWSGGRYRLDLAADVGTDTNQYVVSFIYRGK